MNEDARSIGSGTGASGDAMLDSIPKQTTRGRLRVGDDVIDLGTLRVCSRADQPRLTPKAVDVLATLAMQPGQTLSRTELLDRVWPDTCPTPDVLTQAIAELRRTFGDDQRAPTLIETVPKRGYRLIAPVGWHDDVPPAPAASTAPAAPTAPTVSATPAHVVPVAQALDSGTLDAPALHAHVTGPASAPAAASPSTASPAEASLRPASDGRDKAHRIPPAAAAPVRLRASLVPLLSVVGLLLALGALLLFQSGPSASVHAEDAGAMRLFPRMLTRGPGREGLAQLSNDGSQVIYSVGNEEFEVSSLMIQGVNSPEAFAVPSGEQRNEVDARWSPDGQLIAYQAFTETSCEIRVRPALGGMSRGLAPCEWEVLSMYDWLPDGSGITTSTLRGASDGGIRLIDYRFGQEPRVLDYPRESGDHDLSPRYSSDGRLLAFRRGRNPYSDIYVMETGKPSTLRRLTDLNVHIGGFDWLPDGSALIASLQRHGEMGLFRITLADGQLTALGIAPATQPDIARDRAVAVYTVPRQTWNIVRLQPGEGGLVVTPFMASTAKDTLPAMAPSGDRFAFITDRSGDYQVWLYDIGSGRSLPLTSLHKARPNNPEWRPDGQAVAFVAQLTSRPQAFEVEVQGGELQLLSPPGFAVSRVLYQPDGTLMLIARSGEGVHGAYARDRNGRWQLLARDAAFARIDPADGAVYASYNDRPGIFLVKPSGERQPLPLHGEERRELAWHVEGSRIVYQSMEFAGDALRALDLRTLEDTLLSENLLPAFNLGVSGVDAAGHRYTTVIAADSSDVAYVNLDPQSGDGGDPLSALQDAAVQELLARSPALDSGVD